jgi:type II secretory pathway predicted ATPase ExeA/cell division septation protein DedD
MSTRGPWDVRSERGVRVDALNSSAAGAGLPHPRAAWLTYEPFYGLREQPFSIASNPAFFHQSRSHASTFDDLLAGIRRRERLSVLTGDIGTGKTTLCRAVLQNLDRETFSAFVPDPFTSREDLLKVLLMEFGVMSLDDLTSGRLKTASRTELSYLLYDFLGKLSPLQAFAVVIIDEAQNLSLPLLEEIRILSDADGRDRQLQVVLVGQLELRQKLKLPEMRQVDQRVSVRCHLEPLASDAVAGYIAHRLRVAGSTPDRVSFSPDACDAVYRASGGVPRLINRICDRALHHGYKSSARVINRELVEAAVRELGEGAPDKAPSTVSADAPAVTAIPSVKPPKAAEHHDGLPEWLTVAEEDEAKQPSKEAPRERSTASRAGAASVQHRRSISFPRTRDERESWPQPPTHMQRLMRRCARMAGMVMVLVLAGGAVSLGSSALESLSADLAASPLPSLPSNVRLATPIAFMPPARPETLLAEGSASGNYIIEIARFETPQAAKWLATDLARAGYRAYAVELDGANRGTRHQVAIGPYSMPAEAEPDLQRLHQQHGYPAARLTR